MKLAPDKSNPPPKGKCRILSAVNPAVMGLLAALFLVGRSAVIWKIPAMAEQKRWMLLGAATGGLCVLLAAAITSEAVAALLGKRARFIWTWLLLFTATYFIWDAVSYDWLSLHLTETAPMIWWNLTNGVVSFRPKLIAMGVALLLSFMLSGAYSWLAIRLEHRLRLWPVPQPIFWPLALFAVAGLAATLAKNPSDLLIERFHSKRPSSGEHELFAVTRPIRVQLPAAKNIDRFISRVAKNSAAKYSFYLFIVDSVRLDAITPEIAPELFQLSSESIPIRHPMANSNCSHSSWFAILHGCSPLAWSLTTHQPSWPGSPALRLLRKTGCEIRVYSTPDLNYFNFARTTFGTDRGIANSIFEATEGANQQSSKTEGDLDSVTMRKLKADMRQSTSDPPSLNVIFLDSPHCEYQWSSEFPVRFQPYLPKFPLVASSLSKADLPLLINRYKNAVAYADSIIGQFVQALKNAGKWQNSVIVITGDHGEEFLEEGGLLHGSHLNKFQLAVPIIFHLPPGIPLPAPVGVASHVDILPTILDLAGVEQPFDEILNGRSLLRTLPNRSAVSSQCSSYTPTRLLFTDDNRQTDIFLEEVTKLGDCLHIGEIHGVSRNPASAPSSPPEFERASILGPLFRPLKTMGSEPIHFSE